MADDAETLTNSIRAAAEGAASGTAATIGALGELRGAVLTRLDEHGKRIDSVAASVARVETRLEERSDRLTTALQAFGAQLAAHETRIGTLESARKSALGVLRDLTGWIVGAGAIIWAAIYTTMHH